MFMKVLHQVEDFRIEKDVENPNFLLTNKIGGYVSFSCYPISRYQGVFFSDHFQLYKVIDDIRLLNHHIPQKAINKFWCFERIYDNFKETFFMPHNHNALVYELSDIEEFDVVLDCRESYSSASFGRYYEIYEKNKKIIVKFTKKNDNRESEENTFELYLVIAPSEMNYKKKYSWENIHYSFDEARNSPPFERYVYNALKIKSKRVIFTFSKSEEKAIKESDDILKNLEKLKKKQKDLLRSISLKKEGFKNNSIKMAYFGAYNSLDSLVCVIEEVLGIYAGLYYFWQFWIRDEAISLNALMLEGRFDIAKEILFRSMKNISFDGMIQSIYPSGGIKSADGAGWIFKRFSDMLDLVGPRMDKYLAREDILFVKNKLSEVISHLWDYHSQDGLIVNKNKETWMDTEYRGDSRSGARIEIQALLLSMYELLCKIYRLEGDNDRYEQTLKLEQSLARRVRKAFWKKGVLLDGVGDETIRPNVFLAYYLYPSLLTRERWKECFNNILPHLWNEWGGVATIGKTNPLYLGKHTGENNRSYHRGDSWYYLNNLVALVLHRLDSKSFKSYIHNIIVASTNEILWEGLLGHHAEISSSYEKESFGCLSQAWSNALYIELINEL